MKSELERTFETYWTQLGGPSLEAEYQFTKPRKWRFDFAHLPTKTAIELEGGTWQHGRHNTGAGFAADCTKYNQATIMGWRLFRFTSDMIRNDPAGNLLPVISSIKAVTP